MWVYFFYGSFQGPDRRLLTYIHDENDLYEKTERYKMLSIKALQIDDSENQCTILSKDIKDLIKLLQK